MKYILFSLCIFFTFICYAQPVSYKLDTHRWNPDSLGNHRAVLSVNNNQAIAKARILWRRADENPQLKGLILQDANGKNITNFKTGVFTNDELELMFQPTSGKGVYHLYFMPYQNEGGSSYPKGIYIKPKELATQQWLESVTNNIPVNTTLLKIESVDSFNAFTPLEIPATIAETDLFLKKYASEDFLLFPEARTNVIKTFDKIPYAWLKKQPQQPFKGEAEKGEYYSFQIGLLALKEVHNITVECTNLKRSDGAIIPASTFNCINTSGIDYKGNPFAKNIDVKARNIQPLWCLLNLPAQVATGTYTGTVTVLAQNSVAKKIPISITIKNSVAKNGGVENPMLQTRLHWLNSTMAQENTVIPPYTPLKLHNKTIELLGRTVDVHESGLPAQIQTFFNEEMTGLQQAPNKLITEPIHFHFYNENGKGLVFKNSGLNFYKVTDGTIAWTAAMLNDTARIDVNASLEFDGYISYTIKLKALKDVTFKNINFHIPFTKETAQYAMGLGLKGQTRPDSIKWKWDVAKKNQDGAWVGNVNAGLQYTLRDEHYVRPLNTNFYLQKPLLLPTSWGNNNKGGILITQKGNSILSDNYTGELSMKAGDSLFFNFTLLITPFHTINTDFQWATRFYHKYDSLEKIKSIGATVVNIHHATAINPWINYPFIEWKKMKSYVDDAHNLGLKVKIYNTVRELSNHAYETFALKSLGHEIYSTGKGGGYSWLQEHMRSDYIPAWFVPRIKDAAIINSGMSRWHNYYVEGMNWLTQQVGIDGIYLDDVAFDRVTMKRIKRVLTTGGHPGIIDLHSANQYNNRDGFINSAMLYMEHFPYLNRLWFGEYFDYENNSADFFLTEVSGIPFGLMGEMLEKGGNPWRGMVYGMTNRMPWSDDADPRPLWKLWDNFGMAQSTMIGYWVKNSPVKTSDSFVKATVFKKQGKVLISIASWASASTSVTLNIDWQALGLNPARVEVMAPAIEGMQAQQGLNINEPLSTEKGKGIILIIQEK